LSVGHGRIGVLKQRSSNHSHQNTTMKIKTLASLSLLLAASPGFSRAQTIIGAWNFDNVPIGINASPSPSTGLGTADALGMSNNYNHTNSLSNPDVLSLPASSTGGPNAWRIRGDSTIAGSHGNGWSTQAPIGSQGARFAGSTFGYYQIQLAFDVYATPDAEARLAVQYTTDGSNWNTAAITSPGTAAAVVHNTTDTNTVFGDYVVLNAGWNNQITVNLSSAAGVANNPLFAVRLVNAATGPSCVDTTGAPYNNLSGSWSFDNVTLSGTAIDNIATWSFDSLGAVAAPYNNPPATLGYGSASVLGMNNTYNGTFSTNYADVLSAPGASTGDNSYAWRIRGAPGNGWSTQAPIGTQGAEFDASTVGYSNIICLFDLYLTTQAEAKMCVLYTTNGWVTTNVALNLSYGFYPAYIFTNAISPNTVKGVYFYENYGQGWFNNIVADFTGVPGVDNNPQFGVRIVNAATGNDCLNPLGGVYNNKSGNCRFDNVMIGGTAGNQPPVLNYDPQATVDGPFTNTFTDMPAWRTNIVAIYVNGALLTNTAYTITPGAIIFAPAQSPLLQSSGTKNISILANGFGTARYPQPLAAGVATALTFATPAAGPTASGGTLTGNPVLLVADQYGNGTTNPYANVTVTATVGGAGGWTLGGDTTQTSVAGRIVFTNLTATVNGSTAVSNAVITFMVSGYPPVTVTNSAAFNIGPPPIPFTPGNLAVLQADTTKNNTTFSIIEISPAQADQTTPVNVVPVSATGTNALRLAASGTTGRLALSDDGTLLGFAAFLDDSAATSDETFNLNRAAASMNWSNQVTLGMSYTSISLGGSQARAACVLPDDTTWIADDKGGLYQGTRNGGTVAQPNLNAFNNVVVKTFGGIPYVETQKAVNGLNIPVIYALGWDPETGLYDVTFANNLTTDPNASDFYLVSTNGGATYDILYIADQINAKQGVINKYSQVNGDWLACGSWTNGTGIDGLFATPDGNGGVALFYTTGGGGTANNRVVRVTDAAGWNQMLTVVSSNVLYTAGGTATLKGLTFVPQAVANTNSPLPPPVLTAQVGVLVNQPFTITTTPDNPTWRNHITGITVNGSPLPAAVYDVTQPGRIIFNPTPSTLLQSAGAKLIEVSASGYSTAAVVQNLALPTPAQLTGVTINNGQLQFTFTNFSGLSFSIVATNNLTAPVNTWPVIGTAVETPADSGYYHFSAPQPASNTPMFYRLRQP
jgi:hypothetical protein